jgi:hypothetical protein
LKTSIGFVGASVIGLFYIIPFQDLLVSYLYQKELPILLLKLLLLLKEVIVVSVGVCLLTKIKVSKARLHLSFLMLYILLSFAWSTVPLFPTLVGFRTYLLLYLSFVIGEQLVNKEYFGRVFYKHIKIVFFLVLIFSLLEHFVLPLSIWKDTFPVMEMKREVANLDTSNEYYSLGIPVNAFGELTMRMLGPFDEPLYMAYFTIIIVNFFIVGVFYDNRKPKIKTFLGVMLIVLTQTRAILIGLILSAMGLIVKNSRIKMRYVLGAFAALIIILIVSLFYQEWVQTLVLSIFEKGGRNIGHIEAYVRGLQMLFKHPFGIGIGSASSAVTSSLTTHATENAFINVGLEIGFIGVIWIFGFFVFLILRFRKYLSIREYASQQHAYQTVAAAYLLIIQFTFAGLVAPHVLTARILIPFMVVMGWAYAITCKNIVDTEKIQAT